MPDITMCSSTDCKLRFKCERSKDSGKRPSTQQWYDDFYRSDYVYVDADDILKCDMFKEKE